MRRRFSLDPISELQNYREALRQMIEGGWVLPRDLLPSPLNAVVAAVDILDNGPDLLIKASLPGAQPEDVLIRVLENTLTIQADLREEDDTRGATYLRRERRATRFVRTLQLPVAVIAERAEAHYRNGVLILSLPKSQAARPHNIQVDGA